MLVVNSVFFFRALRTASPRNMIQMKEKADGKNLEAVESNDNV
jgi:hypothetical protein